MSGLFGKTPKVVTPPSPKRTRTPTERAPKIQAAVNRSKVAASQRRGRQSTILSESISGSSGQYLGK